MLRHRIFILFKKTMEANQKNNTGRPAEGSRNADLTDSIHDQERLQGDEATLEFPDVKDIPGQEFIQAPPLGMMADTTISSADEEGEGLFDDEVGDDLFGDDTEDGEK